MGWISPACWKISAGWNRARVVLLHACCHNPTGVDLDAAQWQQVIALLQERRLLPFIDMAYQGFDQGSDADATAVRLLATSGIEAFVVANSYSKSFSLYGERVGALSMVGADRDEAERLQSKIKQVIRTIYSSPSTHGAALVAGVLGSTELRARWEQELGGMRSRIHAMRAGFVDKLAARGAPGFGFINQQAGMFSYSGLSKPQVQRLRDGIRDLRARQRAHLRGRTEPGQSRHRGRGGGRRQPLSPLTSVIPACAGVRVKKPCLTAALIRIPNVFSQPHAVPFFPHCRQRSGPSR